MGKGGGCGASKVARVPSVHPQPIAQDENDEAFWHLYASWTGQDEQQRLDRPLLTAQPQYGSTATATGAVRLSFFLDFIARALPLGDPDMPTWSVALNIVQPATLDKGVPYIGLPEMAQHVQPYDSTAPYYFVSHAWSRPLREAAGLLAHHFRESDPHNVFVWVDVFAVRQQAFTASAGPAPNMAAVDAAVLGSSGVLMCVDEAGHSLRRTWCLYEAWRATHVCTSVGQNTPPSTAGGPGESDGGPVGLVALTPRVLLPEERAIMFFKIDVRQSRSKYRSDRDTLFAAMRSAVGPGGLAAVNWGLRVALCMQPLVPDVGPELNQGRITQVPELWDFFRVYNWLGLTDKDVTYSALALYGPPTSGKSIAAAALASILRSRGLPVAAAFCSAIDVRSLDPVCVVVSLALQLSRLPRLGPRLARQYGNLPPGVMTDLMSYNSSKTGLEAAVEALLVRPLQALLQPQESAPEDEDADTSQLGNGELSQAGADGYEAQDGDGEEGEATGPMGQGNGIGVGGGAGGGAGGMSMRAVSTRFAPPKAVVLIIDGVDQADGSVTGGAAPFDNQVLQLIEEHLLNLPSFVRLVITSRPLPYIVHRLADRLSPLELAPDMLRPIGPFMRNIRLAVATIDSSLNHRQRSSVAANVVTKSRGSLLYIKMALACLEQECRQPEREAAAAAAAAGQASGDAARLAASPAFYGGQGGSVGVAAMGGSGSTARLGTPSSRPPSSSSRRQLGGPELPYSLGELLDRYLANRLRQLPSPDLRPVATAVLAVLVAAREPLPLPQLVAAVRVVMGGDLASLALVDTTKQDGGAGMEAGRGNGDGDGAAVVDAVLLGLGLLIRRRDCRSVGGGWRGGAVQLAHPAVAEWLQQSLPPALLAGALAADNLPTAGHLALAATATTDVLRCLERGKLLPYDYNVRHLFLHIGLAALATAVAEETTAAGGGGCGTFMGGAAGILAAAEALRRRSRRRCTIGADAASTAAEESLDAAADAATDSDWPTVLQLLLQRLDVWTSIYAAGAGGWARSAVLGLSYLPPLMPPGADPDGAIDSPLVVVLGEVRRWLLLFHGQMVWYPMAVVAAAATLPEDTVLRGRALEFSAGPDPYENLVSGGLASATAATAVINPAIQHRGDIKAHPADSTPNGVAVGTGGGGGNGASQEPPPQQQQQARESQHLLLLSTGDMWGACVASIRTEAGRVAAVAMAPSGRLLATVHGGEKSCGVVLWDVWGGRVLLTFAHSHLIGPNPIAAFFTPNGRKLVCAATAGIFIWDAATGRLVFGPTAKGGSSAYANADAQYTANDDPEGPITALAMSPNGDRIAAGHQSGTVRLWEVSSGRMLVTLAVPHGRPVTALAFRLPAGEKMVVAHGEGGEVAPRAQAPVGSEELGDVPTPFIMADDLTLQVWRVVGSQPKLMEVLKGHTGRVNALTFSTLDGNMVTGAADETIRIWWDDPKTPQSDYRQLFILGGAGNGAVHALQYSPAPTACMTPALAAATAAAAAPSTPLVTALSRRLVSSISVKPNGSGNTAAAGMAADEGGADPAAAVAAISTTSLITAAFHANAVLPDVTEADVNGRESGSGSSARNSATGHGPGGGTAGGDGVGGGASGPRAAASISSLPLMAYSSGSSIIRLWSQSQQRQVGLLRGLEGRVGNLQWSGDGRLLVSADMSETGDVRVWDVGGASPLAPLDCSPTSGAGGLPLRQPVGVMALSPDGSRLAVVWADLAKENVRVIDVFTGRRLAVMAPAGAGGHEGKINAVAWSWDSSRLATGSDDQSVRVWYVGPPTAPPGNPLAAAAAIVAAQEQARVERNADAAGDENVPEVAYVAVSGGLVAAARPGLCQLILSGHHRKVQCVAWAHNGRKLASGGYDQMIRIWDTATGEQLNLIYQISWVSALAFSPDDARLASGGGGKAVFIFNSTTGKNLASNPGQAAEQPASEEGGAADGSGGTHPGGEGSSAVRESWMAALRFNPEGTLLVCRDMQYGITLWDVSGLRLRPLRALEGTFREALFCPVTGDLQLYDLTASGSLVRQVITTASLPLGRPVQAAVALSHPLLSFRGVALDTALGHNAAVLLTGDNRAFFFVSGSHLTAVRQEAVRAVGEGGQGKGRDVGWAGGGGHRGGPVETSAAVSRVPSMR